MSESEKLGTIKSDRSKALRAEKTTQKAKALTGETRTAMRYLGVSENGLEEFQVVTTKTESFPEGVDRVTTCGLKEARHWVGVKDPDVIDVAEEDGFEDIVGEPEVAD